MCDGLGRVRAYVAFLYEGGADVAVLAIEDLHAPAEQDRVAGCREGHAHLARLAHGSVQEPGAVCAGIHVQAGAVRDTEGAPGIGRVERRLCEQNAAVDAGGHGTHRYARVQDEVEQPLRGVAHVARVHDGDALLRRGLPAHRVERLRHEQPEDVRAEADLRFVLPGVGLELEVHRELQHGRIDLLERVEDRARPVGGEGARAVQRVFKRLQVDPLFSGPRPQEPHDEVETRHVRPDLACAQEVDDGPEVRLARGVRPELVAYVRVEEAAKVRGGELLVVPFVDLVGRNREARRRNDVGPEHSSRRGRGLSTLLRGKGMRAYGGAGEALDQVPLEGLGVEESRVDAAAGLAFLGTAIDEQRVAATFDEGEGLVHG